MDTLAPSNFYKELFDFLLAEKIKGIKNLKNKPSSAGYHGATMYGSDDYPWIKEVFKRFENYGEELLKPYVQQNPPRLVYEAPYSGGFATAFNVVHKWDIDDRIFQMRANYSCLFPQRVVNTSFQFKCFEAYYWDDNQKENQFCIPSDFFAQLFALKSALVAGLTILLPRRVSYKSGEDGILYGVNSHRWGVHDSKKMERAFHLEADGLGYESFIKTQSDNNLSSLDYQILKTPWLLNCSLDHFVDLVTNHPDEFFLYSHALSKFFQTRKKITSETKIVEWLDELAVAAKELDVKLRQKQRELRFNGLDVGLGLVCTVASLLLPDTLTSVKNFLTATTGTKTVVDLLKWIRESKNIKDEMSSDEYWIMWRSMK
jgi:hypothetical protein